MSTSSPWKNFNFYMLNLFLILHLTVWKTPLKRQLLKMQSIDGSKSSDYLSIFGRFFPEIRNKIIIGLILRIKMTAMLENLMNLKIFMHCHEIFMKKISKNPSIHDSYFYLGFLY